ncbi:hypothetical protein K0M31_019806 [Melipona bicolor]|uniref:Uncharacterized protein n=1 Tax=Melipona bicolor TaxID=60889 RepID=A0AA40KRS6_9HYME|nr:hypothetical protein K0M31_019806 [Melipona bicolor]
MSGVHFKQGAMQGAAMQGYRGAGKHIRTILRERAGLMSQPATFFLSRENQFFALERAGSPQQQQSERFVRNALVQTMHDENADKRRAVL